GCMTVPPPATTDTADPAPRAAPRRPAAPDETRLARFGVPLLFLLLCVLGAAAAHITPGFLLRELLARFARNAMLVLSLLVPILAGLGLNFGIVIGAMAGQVAAILVSF